MPVYQSWGKNFRLGRTFGLTALQICQTEWESIGPTNLEKLSTKVWYFESVFWTQKNKSNWLNNLYLSIYFFIYLIYSLSRIYDKMLAKASSSDIKSLFIIYLFIYLYFLYNYLLIFKFIHLLINLIHLFLLHFIDEKRKHRRCVN